MEAADTEQLKNVSYSGGDTQSSRSHKMAKRTGIEPKSLTMKLLRSYKALVNVIAILFNCLTVLPLFSLHFIPHLLWDGNLRFCGLPFRITLDPRLCMSGAEKKDWVFIPLEDGWQVRFDKFFIFVPHVPLELRVRRLVYTVIPILWPLALCAINSNSQHGLILSLILFSFAVLLMSMRQRTAAWYKAKSNEDSAERGSGCYREEHAKPKDTNAKLFDMDYNRKKQSFIIHLVRGPRRDQDNASQVL